MADIFGTIFGAAANIGLGALNNKWAAEQAEKARWENYKYGEMAAEQADLRTRALYNDFYSPSALRKQYEAAGLSPSLMFGGTPGQGGMSGAQGTGASGPGTPFMPMSMIEGAQIAKLIAETAKTKAETKNISEDTNLKLLEKEYNEWRNFEKGQEFNLLTTPLIKEDGSNYSLFESAMASTDYEEFLQKTRKAANLSGNNTIEQYLNTENGQKALRYIYMSSNRFDRDIEVLSSEKVAANFQIAVMKKLQSKDYAELNAKAAVAQLKALTEVNDLTAEQKGAWNDLLDRMEAKFGKTGKDIALILGMVLQNYMHSSGIQINTGNTIIESKK